MALDTDTREMLDEWRSVLLVLVDGVEYCASKVLSIESYFSFCGDGVYLPHFRAGNVFTSQMETPTLQVETVPKIPPFVPPTLVNITNVSTTFTPVSNSVHGNYGNLGKVTSSTAGSSALGNVVDGLYPPTNHTTPKPTTLSGVYSNSGGNLTFSDVANYDLASYYIKVPAASVFSVQIQGRMLITLDLCEQGFANNNSEQIDVGNVSSMNNNSNNISGGYGDNGDDAFGIDGEELFCSSCLLPGLLSSLSHSSFEKGGEKRFRTNSTISGHNKKFVVNTNNSSYNSTHSLYKNNKENKDRERERERKVKRKREKGRSKIGGLDKMLVDDFAEYHTFPEHDTSGIGGRKQDTDLQPIQTRNTNKNISENDNNHNNDYFPNYSTSWILPEKLLYLKSINRHDPFIRNSMDDDNHNSSGIYKKIERQPKNVLKKIVTFVWLAETPCTKLDVNILSQIYGIKKKSSLNSCVLYKDTSNTNTNTNFNTNSNINSNINVKSDGNDLYNKLEQLKNSISIFNDNDDYCTVKGNGGRNRNRNGNGKSVGDSDTDARTDYSLQQSTITNPKPIVPWLPSPSSFSSHAQHQPSDSGNADSGTDSHVLYKVYKNSTPILSSTGENNNTLDKDFGFRGYGFGYESGSGGGINVDVDGGGDGDDGQNSSFYFGSTVSVNIPHFDSFYHVMNSTNSRISISNTNPNPNTNVNSGANVSVNSTSKFNVYLHVVCGIESTSPLSSDMIDGTDTYDNDESGSGNGSSELWLVGPHLVFPLSIFNPI
ncbi:hypothetical protein AX774_g7254 [Zancudomyces culisetae]|uniref:Uncharacterized protein n=1 Tax=Zancudomyces culisetae TaxID=1213189 RepID=A0A1R1PEJ3_ZANCU|nr:hypothetical protein AX774_g7254 [Zancudomyces culisetae]|eukprot:OMH79338.1 hypothetical protein AX774_g7254 [Zancudomyces culisetae]